MRLKKVLSLIFLASFIIAAADPLWAATIRINAPKTELELAPGESYSGEIIAENPTDEEMNIKVYLEDWRYKGTGTGEKEFSPPGSLPDSASPWITFRSDTDVLKPYGRAVVRYTVSVPAEVSGSYYSVLFFETVLGNMQNEEGANVLVSGRIGGLFCVYIKDTIKRTGEVESVEVVAPKGNSPLQIFTSFKNTGNADIALGGNFILLDSTGKLAARGDLNKVYTQPGQSGKSRTEWVGRLEKGAYDMVLTYDLGKGQTVVRDQTLTVE